MRLPLRCIACGTPVMASERAMIGTRCAGNIFDPCDGVYQPDWDFGIYVASRSQHGGLWQAYRDQSHLPILSSWIDEWRAGETADMTDLWIRNIREASQCRVLLAMRYDQELLKGALVEIGASLGHGQNVIFVGDMTGYSFSAHPNVRRAATLLEGLALARRIVTHGSATA